MVDLVSLAGVVGLAPPVGVTGLSAGVVDLAPPVGVVNLANHWPPCTSHRALGRWTRCASHNSAEAVPQTNDKGPFWTCGRTQRVTHPVKTRPEPDVCLPHPTCCQTIQMATDQTPPNQANCGRGFDTFTSNISRAIYLPFWGKNAVTRFWPTQFCLPQSSVFTHNVQLPIHLREHCMSVVCPYKGPWMFHP